MSIRVPVLDVTAQSQGKVPAFLKEKQISLMEKQIHRGSEPSEGLCGPGGLGKWGGMGSGGPQEQGWDGLWDGNVGNRDRNRSRAGMGREEMLGMGWNGEKWG